VGLTECGEGVNPSVVVKFHFILAENNMSVYSPLWFFFRAGVSTVKSNSIKITSYQLATRLVSVVNLYSLINPIFCRKSPTFRFERRKSDATG